MRQNARWSVPLVVALVGLGGMAMAVQADDHVQLPSRHVGDMMVYTSEGTESHWAVEPRTTWKTMDGQVHVVDHLSWTYGSVRFGEAEWAGTAPMFVSPDGRAVSGAVLASGGFSGSSNPLLGGSSFTWDGASLLEDGAFNGPCGLVHSLQGMQGASLEALGCSSQRFQVTGIERWQGSDVYVFAADEEELWFRPDIPYPVRIIQADRSHELTGFVRGAAPAVNDAPTLQPGGRLPSVPVVDRDVLDVFEPFGFGPRDAQRAAAADPWFSSWHSTHPDAVVSRLSFVLDDDTTTWKIRWADATDAYLLTVRRGPSGADPTLIALGLAEEEKTTVSGGSSDIFALSSSPSSWDGPPDMAALADAWRTFTGAEGPSEGELWAADQADGGWIGEVVHVQRNATSATSILDPAPEQHFEASGIGLNVQEGMLRSVYVEAGASSSPSSGLVLPQQDRRLEPVDVPAEQYVLVFGVAGLAGVLALTLFGLKSSPVAFLWTRRTRPRPTRLKLQALVERRPGIHYQAIVEETGLGKGAVEHHLRRLEADGVLISTISNRYRCYFPPGTAPAVRAAAGTTKSDGAQRILEAIRRQPGSSVAEVTIATGLSPGTVSHHIKRLREAGVVAAWRDGRMVRLRPAGTA